jgi:hypothetical protein
MESRKCKTCGEADRSKFYQSQRTRFCKKCWRQAYPQKGYVRAIQAKLQRVKCADCPLEITEDNHWLFDLDHREGTSKAYNVAQMRTASDAKFHEEMSKCDLVCVVHHRTRTIERLRAKCAAALQSERDSSCEHCPAQSS